MYELILFGNLYTFYNVDYVARIGREVMEREEYYKEIGRHRKLVLILALNCYQHCLENRSFTDADYFEGYVEKLIGNGIKLPKIGIVKAVIHRQPEADWIIKSATFLILASSN